MTTLSDVSTVVYSGDYRIDALLPTTAMHNWNFRSLDFAPVVNTVHYTFALGDALIQDAANAAAVMDNTPKVFNDQQQLAVRSILAHAQSVTGIQFIETRDPQQADFHFANVDLIDMEAAGHTGLNWSWGTAGSTVVSYSAEAFIYADDVQWVAETLDPDAGEFSYEALLREVGRALGLMHPDGRPRGLFPDETNTDYTVMSTNRGSGYKSTFQPYDLMALQWIYGGDGLAGTWGYNSTRGFDLPVYVAPVATNDVFTTTSGAAVRGNVLLNDRDPGGQPLTVWLQGSTGSGSLTLNPNGVFTYAPRADFVGDDIFTYIVSNGTLIDTGSVTILVNKPNEAPQATDDRVVTQVGTAISGNVLVNDSDADGGTLTARVGEAPEHGTLVLRTNGSFTYTPAAGFTGTDSFTYLASDGTDTSTPATVNVQVDPAANTPVYRFVNLNNGAYFYTASGQEKDVVLAQYPHFRFEGEVFYARADGVSQQDDLVTVYRFANLQTGGYFYTANEGEKDLVLAQYPHFRFEGAAFELPETGDLLPVYRFANIDTGGYLFTQNPAEREAARLLSFMREENGGQPVFHAPDQAVDLSLLVSTSAPAGTMQASAALLPGPTEVGPELVLLGQASALAEDMSGV